MPYLARKRKEDLDGGAQPVTTGDLTYLVQQQLNRYLKAKSEVRFSDLAECVGALEAAKADFTMRVLAPYEGVKLATNGDVWDPAMIRRVVGL